MTSNIDVILLPRARQEVREILQYTFDSWGIGQHDAYRQVLDNAFERIGIFPDIGHPAGGQPSNIREYHLRHHVIQYRREPDRVVILRIINPRRRRT